MRLNVASFIMQRETEKGKKLTWSEEGGRAERMLRKQACILQAVLCEQPHCKASITRSYNTAHFCLRTACDAVRDRLPTKALMRPGMVQVGQCGKQVV